MSVPGSDTWPTNPVTHLQRLTEPMTGWPLLGAGVEWTTTSPTRAYQAELVVDGVKQAEAQVAHEAGRCFVGLHIPQQPRMECLELWLRDLQTNQARRLAQCTVAELEQPRTPVTNRPTNRWLSPAYTLGRSLASGECFTPAWWSARYVRYRDFAIQSRQRLRDKRHFSRLPFSAGTSHDAYVHRSRIDETTLASWRSQCERWKVKPLVSILMPVYNVSAEWLRQAVESVRQQIYPHWELCLADDASTQADTRQALQQLPKDPRIKLVRREENGHICAATNSAAELASGEYVAFMDNDDLLAPQALYRLVETLQLHPELDLLYSDEDKITEAGRRYDPQFKPDWSPELLLSYNYINHFTMLRRKLFERVGRLRLGYEGSQDHDLLLRVVEMTDRIAHIPEILYHWRSHAGSTASTASQKPIVQTSGYQAVADALNRRQVSGHLAQPAFAQRLGLPILAIKEPSQTPSVAVLVYGDSVKAGETLRAIKSGTNYPAFTTYLLLDEASLAEGLNRLAAARTEDYLLFLQAGLRPTDPHWLTGLMANVQLPGVSAAGGLILSYQDRIISAGTVLNVGEDRLPGDAFAGQKPEPVSYYFYAEVTRNVIAPARGCLLTSREQFDRLGGLDARHYPRTLFDLDYCLRLAGVGRRSLHVGDVVFRGLPHQHGRHDAPSELATFRQAYGEQVDPYLNPNFEPWEPFTPRSQPPRMPAEPRSRQPVLFGTHNLTAFEGAPKILQDVAIGLQSRGAVAASVFAPFPGRAAAVFTQAGIPVYADEQPYSKRFIDGQWTPHEYEAALRMLDQLLAKVQPSAVLANTLGLYPLVEAAAHRGIPAVLAIQESYSDTVFQRLFNPYSRSRCERAFRYADRVIFASRSCAELYRRFDVRKNQVIIHNGLDPSRFTQFQSNTTPEQAATKLGLPASDGLRIVSLGTICERKAQHHLVEAIAKLPSSVPQFHCYLVGAREGVPYLSYVRNLIQQLNVGDQISVIGETDDAWHYLRAADLFVCCSYVEAHSLSILEAQAFGLAIISTPCGGLDEQVIWNESALQYQLGNSSELAEQLERLLRDTNLRDRMKRESAAHFGLHTPTTGMVERYGQVLNHAKVRQCMSATRRSA